MSYNIKPTNIFFAQLCDPINNKSKKYLCNLSPLSQAFYVVDLQWKPFYWVVASSPTAMILYKKFK